MSVFERFTIEREMALKLSGRAKELETLEMRASSLETRVKHLRNERGIEEELRSRFNVVKEGEQIVVIIDNEPQKTGNASSSDFVPKSAKDNSFLETLKFWR